MLSSFETFWGIGMAMEIYGSFEIIKIFVKVMLITVILLIGIKYLVFQFFYDLPSLEQKP